MEEKAEGNTAANTVKTFQCAYQLVRHTQPGSWVFTFVEVEIIENIVKWVHYTEQFNNYIKGIYLLPIESYTSLGLYKNSMLTDDDTPKKVAKNLKITKQVIWEILVTVNKVSGLRINTYYAGALINSVLSKDLIVRDPAVTAGNIEQELITAIERLKRHNLENEETIDVYLVLPYEIKKHFREENIEVNELLLFTPYYYYGYMNIGNRSSEVKDRFSDPILGGAIEFANFLHCKLPYGSRQRDYAYYYCIKIMAIVAKLSVPILSLFIVWFFCQFFYDEVLYRSQREENEELTKIFQSKLVAKSNNSKLFDFNQNINSEVEGIER
jgi:hypothetical protein